MDWDTKEICGFAIYGLIITNFRICNCRISQEFADLRFADQPKKIACPPLLYRKYRQFLLTPCFVHRVNGEDDTRLMSFFSIHCSIHRVQKYRAPAQQNRCSDSMAKLAVAICTYRLREITVVYCKDSSPLSK